MKQTRNSALLAGKALVILLLLLQPASAQRTDDHWFPYFFANLGGPTPSGPKVSTIAPNGHIYVAGNFSNDIRVAEWDGVMWHVLGDRLSLINSGQADVSAIAVDSSDNVYVGGIFDIAFNGDGTSDSVSNIAKFIAGTSSWESVGEGVDNGVSALVVDPPTDNVYVGGGFTTGTNTGGGVVTLTGIGRWNITTETWEKLGEGVTTIAGFSGGVFDAALESNGNLIIGGNFDKAYQTGGAVETVNSIARWNITTSMWEKFGQGTTPQYSIINSIALDTNDTLYIAGNFQFAVNTGGSQVAGPVAKWDGSMWESRALLTPEVFSISVDGTDALYCLAQQFGGPKTFLHRWTSGPWETIADLQFEGASTTAADLSDTTEYLYMGGRYSEIINLLSGDTTKAEHHATWDGTVWTPLTLPMGVNANIYAIQSDLSLDYQYIGGDFTTVDGIPFNHIARVDGNKWEGLGFGVNGPVYEIHAQNNGQLSKDVFVGGNFGFATNRDGSIIALNNIGKWNATTEQWERFGYGVNGPVYAIQFVYDAGGNPEYLYVGGAFDTATNPDFSTVTNVGNIVRWNYSQNIWEKLGDGVNGGATPAVRDMETFSIAQTLYLYVGGSFAYATNTGGAQANSANIVRLNRFTDTWEAMGQGVDSTVLALAGGSKMWVGGEFSSAIASNGTPISTPYLAFWDVIAEQWLPMGQVNGAVRTIEIPYRGKRYFGGDFTHVGTMPANHIALHEGLVINAPQGWRTLGSGTDGPVNAIDFIGPCNKQGEILFVGGNFTMAGGKPTDNIAKWKYALKVIHPVLHVSSSSRNLSGYRATVGGFSCSDLSRNMLDYTLFDSLTFRGTAFTDSLPFFTPFQLQFAPTNIPFNPIVTFDSLIINNENPNAFLFMGVDDTTLYAPNPDGHSIKFSMLSKELRYYNIPANNSAQNEVELVFANAVTDAPAIDIDAQGIGTLVGNLSYGETADSIAITPGAYTFDVKRNSDGQLLGSYPVDVSGYGNQTIILTVSGFLDPAANQNGPAMDITIHETKFTGPLCTPGLLGDVDDDNMTNSTDGLIILSFDTSLPIPQPILDRINIGFGDVNADGMTNSTDALIILSYDAGIPVPFPVGDPVCLPDSSSRSRGFGKTTPRNGESIRASVMISSKQVSQGIVIDIPVIVDMSNSTEKLGSYTAELEWNPNDFEFINYSGGTTKGFKNPVVNATEAAKGKLAFAHANPYGGEKEVNILNLQLRVKGAKVSGDPISLDFSAMAAAKTFVDLLPYLNNDETSIKTVEDEKIPTSFSVIHYPNPFNPVAHIRFGLPKPSKVKIVVFNILGEEVTTLLDAHRETGYHSIDFDGNGLASGIYFYRIQVGEYNDVKKMILMK